MANIGPQKHDIENVFHRLRSQAANKVCFDCNAKNPTWSSVTYGVFICIDCSAVHRSLGVHLTFVRSTNLDTNWTWIQLRQMQLGGNANAAQFFRQHNCNTTDAQQKYNSRAAQLYRDKLNTMAQNAMKTHGTTLHLDTVHDIETTQPDNEEDFFADCHNDNSDFITNVVSNNNYEVKSLSKPVENQVQNATLSEAVPNVDLLNCEIPADVQQTKSTIGVRKIQPRRGLAGAKKGGLGATKVKTNFADVEQRAQLADQQKIQVPEKKLTQAEEADTIASVRLAYQDLSMMANKEEEKLKKIDPTKAKQMERLGMGFNLRSEISHSALSDMKTISQSATPKFTTKTATYEKESTTKDDYLDDFSTFVFIPTPNRRDRDYDMMDYNTIEPIELNNKNITSMFSPVTTKTPSAAASTTTTSAWSTSSSSSSSFNKQQNSSIEPMTNRSNSNSSKITPGGTKYNTYETDEAQKKFGTAKGISSDQFFNNGPSEFERSANLAKFQGSNSISSADYFGDNNSNRKSTGRNLQYATPDLDDVRESVRQGVTKVAGRLSTIASDVMSSLQDKYGG